MPSSFTGSLIIILPENETSPPSLTVVLTRRDRPYRVLRRGPAPEDAGLIVCPARTLLTAAGKRAVGSGRTPVVCWGPADLMAPAFAAGARDYLREPAPPAEWHARLTRLEQISPVTEAPSGWSWSDGVLRAGERSVILTPGESRLLRLLSLWRGQPVSRRELAWGTPGNGRSVDVMLSRIRRKIRRIGDGTEPRGLRIRCLRKVGYFLV